MGFWSKRNGTADPMDAVDLAFRERGWRGKRLDATRFLTWMACASGRTITVGIRDDVDRRTMALTFWVDVPRRPESPDGAPPVYRIHREAGHSAEHVSRACELLLGKNSTILLGRFERSPEDGSIAFGIALPYRDGAVTPAQILWCVDIGVLTLDDMIAQIEEQVPSRPLRLAV